jgi:hypothetical protein
VKQTAFIVALMTTGAAVAAGCGSDRPTRALLEVSLADGAPSPTQLAATLFDARGTLAARTVVSASSPTLPGLVIVTLPARDQEIRVFVDGGPVGGVARVNVRSGTDTRTSIALSAGIPDVDADDVPDEIDNCPTTANSNQRDSDGDGAGDACMAPVVDGGPDVPPIRIFALHPAIAPAGATITIEGRFGTIGSATVLFPGGVSAPATLLGPSRIRVTVPAGATTGALTVDGDGAISNPLTFRRTRFEPQLQSFRAAYEQETFGRSMPKLALQRDGNVAEVVGDTVYVAGSLVDTRVESARIWADGTLGEFRIAGRLSHTRFHPASVALGRHLYVIGGYRNDTSASSDDIDEATVNADGTLTPFNILPSTRLADPRQLHRAEVIGSWLYLIGGAASSSTTLATIERAPIGDDGTLGAFERVSSALVYPREGHGSAVVGDFLYVFGGLNGTTYVTQVERAPILGDGSLGPFTEQPALELLSPRMRAATLVGSDGVYLIGGYHAGVPLGDILRARIKPNGDLDPFAVSTATLTLPRHKHAAFVAGNRVYVVGAGPSGRELEQASLIGAAQLSPATFVDSGSDLPAERAGGCVTVVNRSLLVISGSGAKTVFRAPIRVDGTIGAFTDTGVSTVAGRFGVGCAIVGDKLHLIGGNGTGSVETAPIEEDTGTLGPFALAVGVTVPADRRGRAIVAGNSVAYVGGDSRQILRAPINVDNTLGAFSAATNQLTVDRDGASVTLLGSTLWLVGGYDPATLGFRPTTEKSTLDTNGVPGPFSAGPTMVGDHGGHVTLTIGGQIAVIGSQYERGVEAGPISPDGATLGPFTAATTDLPWDRWSAEGLVLGDWVYLVAGAETTQEFLRRVDRAPLGP